MRNSPWMPLSLTLTGCSGVEEDNCGARAPTRGLSERSGAPLAAGAGELAGAGFDADADPSSPNDGMAAGACVAFAESDVVFEMLCPNPEKAVEPKGEAVPGLTVAAGEPKEGLVASDWKENGLSAFAVAADGFSGEPLGVSSELLRGAAARGELLLGALELNPRNELVPAFVGIGVIFAGAAADESADEALAGALDGDAGPAAGFDDGTDLFNPANEKEGASSLCSPPVVGGCPKLPKPAGFGAGCVGVEAALLPNEKGDPDFGASAGADLLCSLAAVCEAGSNVEKGDVVLGGSVGAAAKEKGAGDVAFASLLTAPAGADDLLSVELKEKGDDEGAGLAGGFAKLKGDLVGSSFFFSTSGTRLAEFCFLLSFSAFGASCDLTAGVVKGEGVELEVGALALGLLLAKEKG